MNWLNISLLFHLVGVGMIFTLLFAGPVIESNFRWENDVRMKLHSAKLLRSIGLLSPFGALVLVISGIGNMVALEINFTSLFGSAWWLGIKLLIFAALLALGMAWSPKTARQRQLLLEHLSQPNPPEDIDDRMDSLNKRQTTFFVVNWVLVVIILLLTLFKP
jgi:uncharacterized membrane protein SirB2